MPEAVLYVLVTQCTKEGLYASLKTTVKTGSFLDGKYGQRSGTSMTTPSGKMKTEAAHMAESCIRHKITSTYVLLQTEDKR